MKNIWVCSACGSPRVLRDAYVAVNDYTDVRTYDDLFCEDCDGTCSDINEVQVPDDFDMEEGFYKEEDEDEEQVPL